MQSFSHGVRPMYDQREFLITDFPADAISDCSGPGSADDSVEYWVDRLDFRPAPDPVREYLKEFGAWDDTELRDDEQNRRRFFWSLMCDFSEWDGTSQSPCGSDYVCI